MLGGKRVNTDLEMACKNILVAGKVLHFDLGGS